MLSKGKIAFVAGLGVGYVLGTKAGQDRYRQIKKAAKTVRENPTVQETMGMVQAQVEDLVELAKEKTISLVKQHAPESEKSEARH